MSSFSPLRPDYKAVQTFFGDHRSPDRLMAHYVLERHLADRLRDAPPARRAEVYTDVYDELFRSLPDHPQKTGVDRRERRVRRLLRCLLPDIGNKKIFLEIGCGDALLSKTIASSVAHCYALDVTDALIDRSTTPANLDVLITKDTEIPLPQCSVDVALSDQLIEHLHPDDAVIQLHEIHRVLRPGGRYYCITPNRVTGPHDVSCYFDYEAKGFHLREYDLKELAALFKAIGFKKVRFAVLLVVIKLPIPHVVMRAAEETLLFLPNRSRAWVARRRVVSVLAMLNVIGIK